MLIGRSDELAHLHALVADSPADAVPRMVFVDGPIGIGKTTLLTQFFARADLPRLLTSRATETPSHVPLGGLREIVEALLDDELPALLAQGVSMRTLRQRVRSAIADNTVVFVDDVQWLDHDSLDLLVELLSLPTRAGVRFVFAHRSSFSPMRLSRAAARGGWEISRISLAGLGDDDARTLLTRWGGANPSVLRLAGGNPLFLRLLVEHGHPADELSDPAALTESSRIGDTLLAEIAALPPSARTVLHALSLAPPPPPSALGELTQLDENALEETSDLLATHGLTDPLQLEILHPLIRAAAYSDMTAATRRRMHRIAAGQMSGPIDRAAHLRQLGAYLTEDELDLLLEAAAAVMTTAPRSALRLIEGSLRIPHHGRDLLLARALLMDGRPRQAEPILRSLSGPDDSSKEATALLIQALRIQGRPDEAVELVREVADWEHHPEVAIEAATLMVMHEDTQDADLIEKARSSAAPGVSAALSALTALAHLRRGDVQSAREPYDAARDGFTSIAASEMLPVIGAVTAAGWSAHMTGDFEGGAAFVERATVLAERNGRFHALPHLYSILAFLYIPLGRIDEVMVLVDKAIDAARRYDWPDVIPLATTAALVASPDRAATQKWYRRLSALELPRTWWWRQVAALFRARVEIRFGIEADTSVLIADDSDVFGIQKHIGLGELALSRRDIATAQEHADQAHALSTQFGVAYLSGQSAQFRAELLRISGNRLEAEVVGHEAVAYFQAASAPLYVRNMQTWLRRLAASAPESSAVLTPRESDVAELVADGKSNREIAEQLHLSIRTVESHVARILRKRGLRSRAGLARDLDTH